MYKGELAEFVILTGRGGNFSTIVLFLFDAKLYSARLFQIYLMVWHTKYSVFMQR